MFMRSLIWMPTFRLIWMRFIWVPISRLILTLISRLIRSRGFGLGWWFWVDFDADFQVD